MTDKFKPGDSLVIAPADEDDPVALTCSGQVCTFVRYHSSGQAIVTLDNNAKRFHLRAADLKPLSELQNEKEARRA